MTDECKIEHLWDVEGLEHGLLQHNTSGHTVGYVDFILTGGRRVRLPIPTEEHATSLASILTCVATTMANEGASCSHTDAEVH